MADKVVIGSAELWHGDALEVLREWQERRFDAVLTDPPYSRLDLQDGDTLVVRCDATLCHEQAESLRVHLKPIVPAGVKTLILDRGMSLGVIRKKTA